MIATMAGDAVGLMHGTRCVPDVGNRARRDHVYLVVATSHDGHRMLALSPEGWCGWFSVLAIAFSERGVL